MTELPTKLPVQDQNDRISQLEAQVARSRKEIVMLTNMVLNSQSSSSPSLTDDKDSAASALTGMDPDTRRGVFNVMAMSLQLTRVPLAMRFDFIRRRHQRRLANALRSNDLIDAAWYKKTYPEVTASGIEPALYFVTKGMLDGHAPHPKFADRGARK